MRLPDNDVGTLSVEREEKGSEGESAVYANAARSHRAVPAYLRERRPRGVIMRGYGSYLQQSRVRTDR